MKMNSTLTIPQTAETAQGAEIAVSANDYDVVRAFFVDRMRSVQLADYFADSIFRVAAETGENVQTLMDIVAGKESAELQLIMSYYINSLRSRSSLIGVAPVRTPNFYAARNVLP